LGSNDSNVAADKAAAAQYENQQQQIDYMNALISANAPSMSKQEKAQAQLVTQNLQDRQTQIDNAKEDKKSIIALAVAAMQNNPNDPTAQYAAQQALQESNQQQPDLQKALSLVGKYQKDPIAAQQAVANLEKTRADTAKTKMESQALTPGTPANSKAQNALEQQYRTALLKEVSNRSGGVGLQTTKVDQATHLMALVNQYKDANGNYPVTSQLTDVNIFV
jgi:exonuclease VII large subunit